MNRNCGLVCALLLLVATATYAEVVHINSCPYPDLPAGTPANCTVHELRVDPCREALEGKPCKLKRGQPATISFDYTADFSGDNLETRAYWASEVVDLPFLGMNTNACMGTECPAAPGVKRTYSMQIPISKKFPIRSYNLKWKMWNEEAQECCFMFQIKLYK